MAMEHYKIVLVGTLMMASVFVTDAVKCYTCKGTPDSDCAKGVPEKMEVEQCDGLSVCHYTDMREDHERSVSRGCTKTDFNDLCNTLRQVYAVFQTAHEIFECTTCKDEKCNVQVTP
ncbi:hypothetical protein PPYR_13599 [Photinus pyralis]|uniref:Uncharacterized protein n=2 Tax=Photinus pyralis TaxID=7054 RepID=A0A5N4A9K8_PHOPY|nr:uncharacterized protein LOC116179307 [Photinus pyralis]KAB0793979.1 hypothetical protein PPYR_13599 [Photinus pyralis]